MRIVIINNPIADEQLISSQSTHKPVVQSKTAIMTCFEYQRLSQESFAHKQDFDYLLSQALPCFDIVVQAGKLQLLIKHYLAKILLPSGMSLEILPKINDVNYSYPNKTDLYINCHGEQQNDIDRTRRWVTQMLIDISSPRHRDTKHNVLPAINLADIADKPSGNNTTKELDLSQSVDARKPWYDWVLRLAEAKICNAQTVLPNHYQKQIQNTPQAKGKLNLKSQLKNNWHRPHYLHTEQTILQDNTDIVQFLATALRMLQQLTDEKAAVVFNAWSKVTLLPQSQWQKAYNGIMHDKLNWQSQLTVYQKNRLSQAVSWSWWLLNHLEQTAQQTNGATNKLPVPALYINMNHAFEQWVLSRLQVWVNNELPNSQLIIQPNIDWLTAASDNRNFDAEVSSTVVQRLVPDAYIQTADGAVSHVIDIKYKKIERLQDISGSDWQQLYTYKQHLNAKQAWLIYPLTQGFKHPVSVKLATLPKRQRSAKPCHLTIQHKTHIQNKTQEAQSKKVNSGVEMSAIPFDMNARMIVY